MGLVYSPTKPMSFYAYSEFLVGTYSEVFEQI